MGEKIIMWISVFGSGLLFLAIGIYAWFRKEPMWFWAGSKVDASEITDVKRYNRANGLLWITYSLWYFAAGIAEIWSTDLSVLLLILSCTIGLALLIAAYLWIFNQYRVQ